jgi:hypothetical protein
MCEQPRAALAAIPTTWKDAVCPFGMVVSPLSAAAAGFKPWGMVVAAVAYNASLAFDNAIEQPTLSTSWDANGTKIMYLGGYDEEEGGRLVTGEPGAIIAEAMRTDPRYRAAFNQVGWIQVVDGLYVCGVARWRPWPAARRPRLYSFGSACWGAEAGARHEGQLETTRTPMCDHARMCLCVCTCMCDSVCVCVCV